MGGWVGGLCGGVGGGAEISAGGDVCGTCGGRVFFVCEHPKGCVFLRETERAPRETVDKEEGGGGQRLGGGGQRWGGCGQTVDKGLILVDKKNYIMLMV